MTKISELQPRQQNVEVLGDIVSKEEPREFEKFGKVGRVCNAKIKDDSGEVKLSLWNEQVDMVKVGDKVKISNGWVSEWQGELQLSTGKFGQLNVLESSESEKNLKEQETQEENLDEDIEEEVI